MEGIAVRLERGGSDSIERLFRPSSVAVVGVSNRPNNLNRFFLDSLRALGFSGSVYVVNARAEDVDGFPAYARLSDIPGPVDHVIVAVPAAAVPAVLEDCRTKQVDSVTVFSSGFAEATDGVGWELEQWLRDWIQNQPFRVIGPNCMGIYRPGVGLGFRPDFPKEPGTVAFVSQSGGMSISGVLMAAHRGMRFSKVVSYGNEVDLSSVELLQYLSEDHESQQVWLYIEGSRAGSQLTAAMKKVAAKKPLLVLKGGMTESGSRAAASHTGSMAGAADVWQAVLRQAAAVEVYSLEEMIDAGLALQWLPGGAGSRLGIISVSGGLSVNYTDLAVRAGFQVPPLSRSLVERLRDLIDMPGTSLANPLDLAAGYFFFPNYPQIFAELGRCGELDLLILIVALEYLILPERLIANIADVLLGMFIQAGRSLCVPMVAVIPRVEDDARRRTFEAAFIQAKIPVYPTMERALRALGHRRRYRQSRDR
jgi:acyl-CoA synthetase (NDP forming)